MEDISSNHNLRICHQLNINIKKWLEQLERYPKAKFRNRYVNINLVAEDARDVQNKTGTVSFLITGGRVKLSL
jgi:hypothetical protein